MKHCLLSVEWLTRTGKPCLSEKSSSFAVGRKLAHPAVHVAEKTGGNVKKRKKPA
jgi:hypothetical protein